MSHATYPLMIMIICAKYKKNPFRTVDATERTWFSKSRPNDLEGIGQGQGSWHTTHPLMLIIICTKYGKNPSWTVDATGWTRKFIMDRRTDGHLREKHNCIVMIIDEDSSAYSESFKRVECANWEYRRRTDGRTDRHTDRVNPMYPPNFIVGV